MGLDFPTGVIGGAKWALFNMGNGSIHNSSGFTSVTRITTATYNCVFSGNMSDTAYAVTAMGQYEWSFGSRAHCADDFDQTQCRIRHGRYGTGVGGEVGYSAVMVIGAA